MKPTASGAFFRSVLLVDNDAARVREVETLLGPGESRLHIVDDDRDAVQRVADNPDIALIILSAALVGREACDLVHRLRESSGDSLLPILFLTDPDDAAFDVEAVFALGAVDEVPGTRLRWALPAKLRFVLDSAARSHLEHERALAQQADALSEAHRQKIDFLATVAHELRHPLAPMRNGLELMRLAEGDSAELESIRRMMSRQLDHLVHLVHLVEDLLDVTRLTHDKLILKKERMDLRSVLDTALETARPLVDASEHTLTVEIGAEPMPIDADPVRIAQIIIDLLSNAAKYTPQGGRIRVSAATRCDEVHLSVSDTGIGIPEQALTSVFEMFKQLKHEQTHTYDGLGVGLALVQRLLAMHGGSIDAFSAGLGQGSTFRIRLPRATAEAFPSQDEGAPQRRALPGPFRVLVVDDHADARSSFARILDRQRHVTRQARDGAEALRVAAEFRPDIIFLDIGLPDINGRDLAPQLRRLRGPEAVVLVALTGHANAKDHALSAAAGIDHHLTKPTRIQTVHDLLVEIAVALSLSDEDAGREIDDVTLDDLNGYIDTPLVALSVANALLPDQPLITANHAFTELTGYPVTDVIGQNCRFLQGRNREQEGRRLLAAAIRVERSTPGSDPMEPVGIDRLAGQSRRGDSIELRPRDSAKVASMGRAATLRRLARGVCRVRWLGVEGFVRRDRSRMRRAVGQDGSFFKDHIGPGFDRRRLGLLPASPSGYKHIVTDASVAGATDHPDRAGSLGMLSPGETLVHLEHGIGRYEGLKRIDTDALESEFVTIRYACDTRLHVPVHALHLVAAHGARVDDEALDKLGSKRWFAARQRATASVRDVALQLFDARARRAAVQRAAYSVDAPGYARFADRFAFDPTPDQQRAFDAVMADMRSARPMDRVICGDVGFGKTEVAMRAAWIATQACRQVAVLVPTTLLAAQHLRKFTARFAGSDVRIAALSRLEEASDQAQTLEALARGEVDVVIGTHRLLGDDVAFADLGLVGIDEEHRFGVQHKERVATLRQTIDVITMTATPISRTLGMSLEGLRDVSVIRTPRKHRQHDRRGTGRVTHQGACGMRARSRRPGFLPAQPRR